MHRTLCWSWSSAWRLTPTNRPSVLRTWPTGKLAFSNQANREPPPHQELVEARLCGMHPRLYGSPTPYLLADRDCHSPQPPKCPLRPDWDLVETRPRPVPLVSLAALISPQMDLNPCPRLPTPSEDCYLHWLTIPGPSPMQFAVLKSAEHRDACFLKPNGIWTAISIS